MMIKRCFKINTIRKMDFQLNQNKIVKLKRKNLSKKCQRKFIEEN